MLEAVVTSVPSTGTNWLLMQLLPYFGDYRYLRQIIDGKDTFTSLGFTHYAISNVTADEVLKASEGLPLYTPLRDPLLALTTWASAGTLGRDTVNRLRGWEDMAAVDARRDVTYIPVDRPDLGAPVMKKLGYYANFGHPINSKRGRHANREAYERGDYSYVPAEYWARLRALEPAMRPILERVGYTNLGWWS